MKRFISPERYEINLRHVIYKPTPALMSGLERLDQLLHDVICSRN